MREGWKRMKFEDCLQKVKSSKKIPKKSFLTEGLYPIVSQEKELINGYWNNSEDVLKVEKPIVIFGDHTKIVKHIEFDFVKGADGIVTLLPIKEINSKFFTYQLKNIELRDLGYARHYRLLKENEIVFPQLEEQKQIVAILDKAFTAIDQAKANISTNIENAKELFQSKLNDIFSQKGAGWEEKTLIEVNKFIDYRGKTPKKTGSGIKLITAKNVRMGYMRTQPEEFIAEEDYEGWMTRGIPKEGDVLFTTEAPLANVTLLNTNEKIALAQRIITLCPNREILSGEYLTFCLQSKVIQDKILEKGTGATVTGIKSKLLKEIMIPIPPPDNQANIVNVMSQMKIYTDQITNNLENKLENLEELKKSILQKAFAGELTQKEVTV